MEGCKKIMDEEKNYSSNKRDNAPKDDLDFKLWKSELNSELLSFWKSMVEGSQD